MAGAQPATAEGGVSLHKGNHVKMVSYIGRLGENPDTNVKGVIAAAKAIRNKHRSPFGFCGPRLSRNSKTQEA